MLRLLRGESAQLLSRELGVEIYRLEQWRSKALARMETDLKEREGAPLKEKLYQARKRIAELSMENELLRMRMEKQSPFGWRARAVLPKPQEVGHNWPRR